MEGVSKSLNTPTCKNANLSIYGLTYDKLFSTSSFFPILNKNAPSPYIYKLLNTIASMLKREQIQKWRIVFLKHRLYVDVLIEVFHSQ